MPPPSLQERLDARTAPASPALVEPLPDRAVRCLACGNRCAIRDGARGACQVRHNRGGTLFAPRGYVAALQCDPIEKKPFFHAFPGRDALSFGMLGCNLHCAFCQNWVSSQSLRDPAAGAGVEDVTAETIVAAARRSGAAAVVSTYNEPLITAEWAIEVFRPARAAGLATGFVSNGFASEAAVDYLRPWIDLCKVDLKCFDDARYRGLGGVLADVRRTIERLVAAGVWVEIVTLLVPGFNDDPSELRGLARFLAGVSPDLPWHVTAYHPDYRHDAGRSTTAADLERAASVGQEAGLRFVYAGNRPGETGSLEQTRCPGCGTVLIDRAGFRVLLNRLQAGACPDCGRSIPGRWESSVRP
jgi:pyruvate formate lyase activating enzyme